MLDKVSSNTDKISVPNIALGMVLDNGRASAYAAHLLAISAAHGTGFSLNKWHVRDTYGMGLRGFAAGIKLLTDSRVLDRQQAGPKQFAQDISLVSTAPPFVRFPRALLGENSTLVAFILAALMSPTPRPAGVIGKRVGVRSRTSVGALVVAARRLGVVDVSIGQHNAILVGRPLASKNVVSKNVVSKNVATQKIMEDDSLMEDSHQHSTGHPTGGPAASAIARLLEVAEDNRRLLGWLYDDEEKAFDALREVTPDEVELVLDAETDAVLREHVRNACGGRVHADILSPPGLAAIRHHAAAICCVHDTVTPQHAITLVVDAMRQLIGAEGKWLNSMGIIGKRIGFALHAGDLTIVAGGLPIIDVEEDG